MKSLLIRSPSALTHPLRLWGLMLFAGTLLSTSVFAAPVIIVNPEIHATADLNVLKKLFLGKERSLDGVHTVETLDVEEGNPIRSAFLEKFLGKSEGELRQYWSRLVFTGKATPPRIVGNDEAVRTWVAHHRDAIGCIDASKVDPSVRVLGKIQ